MLVLLCHFTASGDERAGAIRLTSVGLAVPMDPDVSAAAQPEHQHVASELWNSQTTSINLTQTLDLHAGQTLCKAVQGRV